MRNMPPCISYTFVGDAEAETSEDKALRVLSACTPIYLDPCLLILRGLVPSCIFVFVPY